MRVVSLGVSLLLGACNGSAGVSEQPLVIGAIEVPPSDPEGPPAEHLDPLREGAVGGLVVPAGLADPTRVAEADWISVEPSDLATATADTHPSLVFGPDASEFDGCVATRDCIRVVTYPEGAPVESEVVVPESAHGDISRRIMLIPRRPLEARWYAVEVAIRRRVHETVAGEAVQRARFRPDSHPILTHALANGTGTVELRFSERVVGDQDSRSWAIEDEDGVLRCDVVGPSSARPETRAVFTCERPITGVMRVRFGSTLRTVLGTELALSPRGVIDAVELDLSRAPGLAVEEVVRLPLYRE